MPNHPLDPFQAMRTVGLLLMVVMVATNVVPGLRRHARWIVGIAAVLYLAAGVVFYVIGWGW